MLVEGDFSYSRVSIELRWGSHECNVRPRLVFPLSAILFLTCYLTIPIEVGRSKNTNPKRNGQAIAGAL